MRTKNAWTSPKGRTCIVVAWCQFIGAIAFLAVVGKETVVKGHTHQAILVCRRWPIVALILALVILWVWPIDWATD